LDDTREGPWNVLLVDDDEDDFLITSDSLKHAPGVRTRLHWASSYAAGLQMLAAGSYDAVLVDYDLGAQTGIQFIRQSLLDGCRTPLIVFTGRVSFETEIEAMEAGASVYIVKSEATPRLLKRTLRYAIERRRIEDELDRRSQERLDILESIQDGFLSLSRNWTITYINRRAAQNGGHDPLDLIGKDLWEMFPGLQATPFEKAYRQALQERVTVHFETAGVYHGSSYSVTVYPSAEGISIFWQDITERKRREVEDAFIIGVNEDFAHLASPPEIMLAVGKKMMAHFELSRVAFAYVDEDAGRVSVIHDEHLPGLPDALGEAYISNLIDPYALPDLIDGRILSIQDVTLHPLTAQVAGGYLAVGARAQLTVPYISENRWQFVVLMQKSEPYAWTAGQINLIERLAPRLYLTIERARAVQALRESEAKYRLLADLSPNAILVNLNGRYVYANPAAARLLGFHDRASPASPDLVGCTPFDFLDPQYHDLVRERNRHVIEDKLPSPSLAFPWKRLDGSVVDVEVVGGPIIWQGEPAVLVIARDITERKRLEQALLESEYRFRSLADGVPLILWVTPADGRLQFVNRAYTEFFGVTVEQVEAGNWRLFVHPEDDYYVRLYQECLRLRQPFQAEARVLRHDGQWRRIVSTGRPRFSGEGEFLGMAGCSFEKP